MDKVIVIGENEEEKYISKYEDIVNWSHKKNAVQVINVVYFFHMKGNNGCVVETENSGEIKFSKGSEVVRGE